MTIHCVSDVYYEAEVEDSVEAAVSIGGPQKVVLKTITKCNKQRREDVNKA